MTANAGRQRLPERLDELSHLAAMLRAAQRPIVLAGAMFAHASGPSTLAAFERQTRIPAVLMESPRGLNDPSLGAFAESLKDADMVVLVGKPLDFTLKFGARPWFAPTASVVVIDPDPLMAERVRRERPGVLAGDIAADTDHALGTLGGLLDGVGDPTWLETVQAARRHRPAGWADVRGSTGRLHPVEMCRAVEAVFADNPDAVFIADGGEIGQWAQACISAPRRIINGVAGSIGASIPFALAARVVEPDAPVIAVMGDGTFGFHMAEFDTAVRHNLPFVAVVGNDAAWNAELQIQLRTYGRERAHGCTLLPTRYDQVVTALGGHGEFVTSADQLPAALARAIASGKPACVNVMIESHAAPVVRRGGS